jgi:hypothetical protein
MGDNASSGVKLVKRRAIVVHEICVGAVLDHDADDTIRRIEAMCRNANALGFRTRLRPSIKRCRYRINRDHSSVSGRGNVGIC